MCKTCKYQKQHHRLQTHYFQKSSSYTLTTKVFGVWYAKPWILICWTLSRDLNAHKMSCFMRQSIGKKASPLKIWFRPKWIYYYFKAPKLTSFIQSKQSLVSCFVSKRSSSCFLTKMHFFKLMHFKIIIFSRSHIFCFELG